MSLSPTIPDLDLLRQIAQRSLSAFFVYNLQTGLFEYVSPAFEEIWGRQETEVNGQLDWLVGTVHPDDLPLLRTTYDQLRSRAMRQFLEFRLRLAHREKWILLTAYAILKGEQRQAIAGFAEDITSQKENEATLSKYGIHKNGILEMLAHDLNGPLGVVRNLAGQLAQKARQHNLPEAAAEARLIEQTVAHSIAMIHDLLEKEFLESAGAGLKFSRIDLVEQINMLLQGLERMDHDHHKHFEVESSAPQVYAEVDRDKFMHVIQNLVSNAMKFTPAGGHIRVGVQQEPDALLISVRDDGIGIPKDLQPLLFDRFTRARRPGLQGEVTTGLGLSIVKRVVEMHGGSIRVESEEHKGATFFVRIPLRH
jgi:two-component system sensor histidine kinase VicK